MPNKMETYQQINEQSGKIVSLLTAIEESQSQSISTIINIPDTLREAGYTNLLDTIGNDVAKAYRNVIQTKLNDEEKVFGNLVMQWKSFGIN